MNWNLKNGIDPSPDNVGPCSSLFRKTFEKQSSLDIGPLTHEVSTSTTTGSATPSYSLHHTVINQAFLCDSLPIPWLYLNPKSLKL